MVIWALKYGGRNKNFTFFALYSALEGRYEMEKEAHYRVVSLFSGCGGMDLGFKGGFSFLDREFCENKFNIIWANDIMKEAVETYRYNFGNHVILCDISKILAEQPNLIPECEVVLGGFPCQDFSIAGKRRGLNSDRGRLYEKMREVIRLRQPLVFVAENVKGLTNIANALEIIVEDFAKVGIGYKIYRKVLNAADYGVPQTRERLFIVGFRRDIDAEYEFPNPTHSPGGLDGLEPWVTAREAIDDLWGLEKTSLAPPNHDQISMAKNYGSHCQGNKPIRPDLPGPTIRAEHHGNIEFHYRGTRRLSVRECCRIQSFPDNFIIKGSTTMAYKQVGNAVPPVLAWHIAKSVQVALDDVNKCLAMSK